MKLTVLTYNTLFAGWDGSDDRRAQTQVELIQSVRPDIFLMQEARGYADDGQRRLFELEARLGMRGFLALAPRTGQHVAIFLRAPLSATRFDADSATFHHALATLTVRLPDHQRPLTLLSAHLCPNGPEIRRREAETLAVLADPERLLLLAGDFNTLSPHDPEPAGFAALPAQHRARYASADGLTVDRQVLSRLEMAGWVDIGHLLGHTGEPTVPTASFTGSEFASMRCDYVLTSRLLAGYARDYQVLRTAATDTASDHFPVLATFEIPDEGVAR